MAKKTAAKRGTSSAKSAAPRRTAPAPGAADILTVPEGETLEIDVPRVGRVTYAGGDVVAKVHLRFLTVGDRERFGLEPKRSAPKEPVLDIADGETEGSAAATVTTGGDGRTTAAAGLPSTPPAPTPRL